MAWTMTAGWYKEKAVEGEYGVGDGESASWAVGRPMSLLGGMKTGKGGSGTGEVSLFYMSFF